MDQISNNVLLPVGGFNRAIFQLVAKQDDLAGAIKGRHRISRALVVACADCGPTRGDDGLCGNRACLAIVVFA